MKRKPLVSAWDFWSNRVNDGRAIVRYDPIPDSLGHAEPSLWLCLVGGQLFACDDCKSEDVSLGFLEPVSADTPVQKVIERRNRHKLSIKPEARNAYVIKASKLKSATR